MALIQPYSKAPVICNLRKFCIIIVLMTLSTSFLVLVKSMSDSTASTASTAPTVSTASTASTPTLLQTTVISVIINSSSVETFYPNIAVLVEFRAVDHIIAIVHNVNRHIPSSWPIQIFHGKHNEDFIKNSTLAPLIASGKVFLTLLNETFDRGGISHLLTNASFWKHVRGEKILFFQIDSVMCSNSRHKITDFLQYDYIGAPWDLSWYSGDENYLVGNGGFSLRTRSKILALLAFVPHKRRTPEDVYYAQNMHRVNGLIPPVEIAKTFAVESMYYDRPLGVHRYGWSCEFRAKLAKTCPESMLITSNIC